MQLLLVIIEKIGEQYSAYVPSLIGVAVIGGTREEVERNITAAIHIHLTELDKRRYFDGSSLLVESPRQLSFPCGWQSGEYQCGQVTTKSKDGLCFQHWRMAYGHSVFNLDPKSPCLLCGETNQWVLDNWDMPCPVKAENPEWPVLLAEARARVRAARKEVREATRRAQFMPAPISPSPARPKRPPLLTQKEFARRAGISVYEVRKLVAAGKLQCRWDYRGKIFQESELERFLAERAAKKSVAE
jgi:predicted RNase H-like HicB family nuclease